MSSFKKLGAVSIILGSILLSLYSIGYWCLLPVSTGQYDYVSVVQSGYWRWLALIAFIAVVLMLLGFSAVYSRIAGAAGLIGFIGFLAVEFSYLLQACKVTWELFIYPILAAHSDTAYLLRDGILKHDPAIIIFKILVFASILIGIVFFCWSLWSTKIFSKLSALLIFSGALVYGIGPMFHVWVAIVGILILSLGCFFLGKELYRELPPGQA